MMSFLASTLLISLLGFGAKAVEVPNRWTKMIDCHQGETVIDVAGPSGASDKAYQIVFRHPSVLATLLQTGAVNTRRLTSLSEIVLRLTPNISGQGWISEDDARETVGSVHYVSTEGDLIRLNVYRTQVTPDRQYRRLDQIGEWIFDGCVTP